MIDNITIKVVCFKMAHYFAGKTKSVNYNGIIFNPVIHDNQIIRWTGKLKNLYLAFRKDELTISNSIHKFHLGNNYCDFNLTQLIQAFTNLSEILDIDLSEAEIKKVEYGCNIPTNEAAQFISSLIRYRNKFFVAMHSNSEVYGKKVFFTDYAIKFYDKQTEVKIHDKSETGIPLLRYEKEAKARYFKQKSINIRTVNDLLRPSSMQILAADLIASFREIHKRQFIDLPSLSIEELKKYSLLQNNEVLKVALKKHRISVNRYQKELAVKIDPDFYDNIEYLLTTKFQQLIA